MDKRMRGLLAGAICLVLLTGCGLLPQEEEALAPPVVEPEAVDYETVAVERKDMVKQERRSGSVVAVEGARLAFAGDGGQIGAVHVQVDQKVQKGDVLAELDTGDLASRIRQQEIAVRKAEMAYQAVLTGNITQTDLARAKRAWQGAEEKISALESQRQALLDDPQYVAGQEIQVEDSRAKWLAAKETLAELQAPDSGTSVKPSQIAQAEVDLQRAKNQLDQDKRELAQRQKGKGTPVEELNSQIAVAKTEAGDLKAAYEELADYKPDPLALESAQLDVESAGMGLPELKEQLEAAKLYAPMDGTVTYLAPKCKVGESVLGEEYLIKLSKPGELEIEYAGDDADIFKMGDKVQLKIGEQSCEGEVVLTPGERPQTQDNERDMVTTISFPQLKGVALGDTAHITLVTGEAKAALVLPADAVHNAMGRRYVFVYEDNQRIEKTVKVGLETATECQIESGLEEGELAILD